MLVTDNIANKLLSWADLKSRVSTYDVNCRVQILEHVAVDLMMTFIANTILRVMFICAFSYALLSIEHIF